MEETNPVEVIREKLRIDTQKSQAKHRITLADRKRFGLKEIEVLLQEQELLTEKDITGLASRIKRRKHATEEDLTKLSAAFVHNTENISTFCKITGALNVIVKEFTGNEYERQLLAAECLCNISLGEEACSRKVAQFASSYLVTYLNNVSNQQLFETCLWIIQNLIISGSKCREILIAQDIPMQLINLHATEIHDPNLIETLEETLAIWIIEGWSELNQEFKVKSQKLVVKLLESSSNINLYGFYIVFEHFEHSFEEFLASRAIELSIQYLIESSLNENLDYAKCFMSMRILTNIILNRMCPGLQLAVDCFVRHKLSIVEVANRILSHKNETLTKELLWMVSSLFHVSQGDQSLVSYFASVENFEQNLRIPIEYL